jgi:hypothetical protein
MAKKPYDVRGKQKRKKKIVYVEEIAISNLPFRKREKTKPIKLNVTFRCRLADYSNRLKGCPKIHIWEPKPHSARFGTEPYHGSRFICQTTRNSPMIPYVFNRQIKICGSAIAVTSFRYVDLTIK